MEFVTERPEALEQLVAIRKEEAVALTACLRGLGIGCQVGTTPQTGGPEGWWIVWVTPRQLTRALLVKAGFSAGIAAEALSRRS